MTVRKNPLLFQINTRVYLREQQTKLGRPTTLADIPDELLDSLAAARFDWVWMLGVWTTGPTAKAISRAGNDWRQEMQAALPDLTEDDICGSPFAICAYEVHPDFGGPDALAHLRKRLHDRGINLMTDFVPNHTAPDHPWAFDHPEYYVAGSEQDLLEQPFNYMRVNTRLGDRILAHGRDPYFAGWADTLQLNYCSANLQSAQRRELMQIAKQCDGVRCDMAMLLLPEIIERTWGAKATLSDGQNKTTQCFWPTAIQEVRANFPEFTLMAEVYWNLEWELQQQGFNFTYDKSLYDRLMSRDAETVRNHFHADLQYQQHCARFLENHDEPRAAKSFPNEIHQAAATIAFLSPGLRFFHEGQLDGRTQKVSMHVGRRSDEPINEKIRSNYNLLLVCLKSATLREGHWQLLTCLPEWEGNSTHLQFIAFSWMLQDDRWLICVNYGAQKAQCFVQLPWQDLDGRNWIITNQLEDESYEREGSDLTRRGLYLNVEPWKSQVFRVAAK